jgi:hypothetical protein
MPVSCQQQDNVIFPKKTNIADKSIIKCSGHIISEKVINNNVNKDKSIIEICGTKEIDRVKNPGNMNLQAGFALQKILDNVI